MLSAVIAGDIGVRRGTGQLMERFRLWLREWLGISKADECFSRISVVQEGLNQIRAEVTRLSIAQYVPPSQPEPERKIVRTQTTKQYLDILEREQEALMHEEV